MTVQTALLMTSALTLVALATHLVRRRLLSIRYGIGWLMVGIVGFSGAPLLTLLSDRLDVLGFTPTGFSLGVFIVFLGLLCLQLSISLSGLQHAIQDLAEHSAHVEARVRELEGRTESDTRDAPATTERMTQ